MKRIAYSLVFFTLLLFSCKEDNLPGTTDFNTFPQPENVQGSVNGRVMDTEGNPVMDATVNFYGQTMLTNEFGLFQFNDVSLNANGTFISVEKDGYFQGSRRFYPQADALSRVEIELMEMEVIGTVNSAQGGLLQNADGIKINFPENAFIDESGNPYSGTVEVNSVWLDPTADNINSIMPGDLTGLRTDDNYVALATYGMMAVELRDQAGNELNLADGKMAELTFPVPAELMSSAPSTIPLWYFDESEGIWKEEGEAVLQGDTYVGSVSHFSFWNCDVPHLFIELSGTVFYGTETPADGLLVGIEVVNGAGAGWGITNSNGQFQGAVPKEELLQLSVYDACGGVIHTEQIGPFSEDASMIINVDAFPEFEFSISGTMVDCDGNNISNGSIYLNENGTFTHYFSEDGSFDISYISCQDGAPIEVAFFDSEFSFGDSQNFIAGDNVNLGTVSLCDEVTEIPGMAMDSLVFIEVDSSGLFGSGNRYEITSMIYYPAGDSTIINCDFGTNSNVTVGFLGTAEGFRTSSQVWLRMYMDSADNLNSPVGTPVSVISYCTPLDNPCTFDPFNIVEYEGTSSGSLVTGFIQGTIDFEIPELGLPITDQLVHIIFAGQMD